MKIVIYNEKDDFNNLKQNIENFFMKKMSNVTLS